MYAIYTTSGFIVGSKPYGEAGKVLFIFTRDFGLVTAIAQGIRLEKSKLRYGAQDCSLGDFSFVKGKEFWRLTSIGDSRSATDVPQGTRELIARLGILLRRFIQGEDCNIGLFDHIEDCVDFLGHRPELTDEQLKTAESIAVFGMLELLGYIGKDPSVQDRLAQKRISVEMLDEMLSDRLVLNKHINKALRESHL